MPEYRITYEHCLYCGERLHNDKGHDLAQCRERRWHGLFTAALTGLSTGHDWSQNDLVGGAECIAAAAIAALESRATPKPGGTTNG